MCYHNNLIKEEKLKEWEMKQMKWKWKQMKWKQNEKGSKEKQRIIKTIQIRDCH